MADKLNAYSTYDDIEDVSIRTWNRCQTAINVRNDLGAGEAERYLGKLDKISLMQVQAMFTYAHIVGEDVCRRKVFRGAL